MKKAMKQSTLVFLANMISIILLLLVSSCVFAIVVENNAVKKANDNRFDLTYNANRFMNGSAYLTSEVRAFAATGDPAHYDNYWNEVNTLKNRDIGVAAMKKIGITGDEQAKIEEMSALSNNLIPLEEAAMEQAKSGKTNKAIASVFGSDYETEITKISALKQEFLTMLDKRAKAEVDKSETTVTALISVTIVIAILIVLLQIFTYLIIRKKVIRPIIMVKNEMEEISKGNLSNAFTMEPDTSEIGMLTASLLSTKEELGRYVNDISDKLTSMADGNMDLSVDLHYIGDFAPIKDALVRILDSLNHTLTVIRGASDQVSSGADQVANGAQALSQGAVEQTNAVEKLAAALDEISRQIQESVSKATDASHQSTQLGSETNESNHRMQDMLNAMNNISDSSNQIGKIIKTIEDIAFQTNILALNAAVEAARAGEAGKGFAVVADEVGNLATKSADASKDTARLISESLDAVENGSKIANETAMALEHVITGITTVSTSIHDISNTADRESQAITQINTGIEQISNVVHTTSATAQESAAASEELSGQAIMLRDLTSKFRLRKENN